MHKFSNSITFCVWGDALQKSENKNVNISLPPTAKDIVSGATSADLCLVPVNGMLIVAPLFGREHHDSRTNSYTLSKKVIENSLIL